MKRTTPLTRHIGGKVREYRLKNGWTQTELAARMQVVGCDLSREIIARIESGFRQTTTYSHNRTRKMQRQEKQFFLPLLCPVKRYLLYHLWFAVYRNE